MSADKEQSTPSAELKIPSSSAVARLRQLASAGLIELPRRENEPRRFYYKTVPKSALAKQIRSELEESGLLIYNTATHEKDGINFVDVFIDGSNASQIHVPDSIKECLKKHLRSAALGDVFYIVSFGAAIAASSRGERSS